MNKMPLIMLKTGARLSGDDSPDPETYRRRPT